MYNAIASQLIRYYLPGFISMFLQYSLKGSLRRRTISSFLEKHINNFTIFINRSPEIMLLTLNPDENFINEKCIAITLVFSLQPIGIFWAKSIAP